MPDSSHTPQAREAAADDWPYDAERGEWADRYRLPVVSSPYPRWKYHLALVVSEGPWEGVRPSEAEVKALAVALDQMLDFYNPHYRERLRERPFDIDSGTNTLSLLKRPDGGWCYRRMTWMYGPPLVPAYNQPPASLLEVLDRIFDYCGDGLNPKWEARKAEHADVFSRPEVTTVAVTPAEPPQGADA